MPIIHNHPKVAAMITEALGEQYPGDCYTIALVENEVLIAGALFNWYTGPSIQVHGAAAPGKNWCQKEFLKEIFNFAFNRLKCNRVTALVAESNRKAIKFTRHVGFKEEGVIRQGAWDENLVLHGMLKEECRWLD